MAYHSRASGSTDAAYNYSVQAGIEAVAVFAVADAIGLYEQARALLQEDQRLQTRLLATEVERLYVHLGQAYSFQNDLEKAQKAYEELLAFAQHQHQFTLASMTLNRLALLTLPQSSDKPQVDALLEQALWVAQTNLIKTHWRKRNGTWPRLPSLDGTIQRVPCLMENMRSPWHEKASTRNSRQEVSSCWDGSMFARETLRRACAVRSVPGTVCAPEYRVDRFAGAATSLLCHWRSTHPILDQSSDRSRVLGDPGYRTNE